MIKAYYILKVNRQPNFESVIHATPQVSFIEGKSRDPITTITRTNSDNEADLISLKIHHEVKEQQSGITTVHVQGNPQSLEFEDFLIPEKFDGYYCRKRQILILKANKKTINSAKKSIKQYNLLDIETYSLNYNYGTCYIDKYKSVWINHINTNLSSAYLNGTDLSEEDIYNTMRMSGELRNISFYHEFNHSQHHVMITKESGILLFETYEHTEMELEIVLDVFDKVVGNMWKDDPDIMYD